MSPKIRPVATSDTEQMADLLNEIIAIGGTTAYLDPVSAEAISEWVARGGTSASWHVADQEGVIVGFQWAEPHKQLPKEAASVATFVRAGAVGHGIGTKLFETTTAKSRALGFEWLNASIRSDNASGLSYYSKMGFEDWKIEPNAALSDGRITGKTHKRYNL